MAGGAPATGSQGGSATTSMTAAQASTSARLAAHAVRQKVSEDLITGLAAAICGIIAIFTILHWTRVMFRRSRPSSTPTITKPFVAISRKIRNLLVRPAPGFNSAGHGLLVVIYIAINLALLLVRLDHSSLGNDAARWGWVLISNMCFVVFLALKNTPLAYLTSYSYERLNNLHQIAGVTTFFLMVVHAATYTHYFLNRGMFYKMQEHENVAGIISGFGFLGLVCSALIIRRFSYETFYVIHVLSFIMSVVGLGFHRPDFHENAPIVTCITAGMFIADRLIRIGRFLINSVNNDATIYPLSNGATRIVLAKIPPRASPGKHCFVWIPKIRLTEMHPFTIISTEKMEFVVKSYNGFTRDLHAYATANPGAKLKASVEGPYGTFPDPMQYDKIVLIAGGSGASYTFGLACNLLEKMDAESTKNIVFIWSAKTEESLSWFKDQLRTLNTHVHSPKVKVSLFVTRAPSSSSSNEQGRPPLQLPLDSASEGRSSGTSTPAHSPTDPEKQDIEKQITGSTAASPSSPTTSTAGAFSDPEKQAIAHHERAAASTTNVSEAATPLLPRYSAGRPDAATLIREAVSSTQPGLRILVAACGPASLMKVARKATAECIKSDGPGVELHCEQFGW